jgi:hypothetical protein
MAERRLDDVSANLGEVLRHADELLAEWSRFGTSVRAQVEREAAHIGRAVSDGAGAAVERAVHEQLASLARELAQLEQRARGVSRSLGEGRAHDHRLLGAIAGGVALAIVLLVVIVVRGPGVAPAPVATEPARLQLAPAAPLDARSIDASPPPDAAALPTDAPRPARRR